MSQSKDQTPEGGGDVEPCPYCKGSFPRNLPLVNGETQLQKHIKVFHRQYARDV
ncbi:MAG TPA: hypothetical protein VNE86_01110 [Nitrososphaerales archaeon]|nr:hypothetical protein [Nitrososphaerales archaeon]